MVKNRIQTGVNYRFPWGILVNSNIVAYSGHPYNETLGTPNADGQFNLRPAGIDRNSLTGPGFFNVNMNVTKTFILREGGSNSNSQAGNGRPGAGQPGGGFGRGDGALRGGPGGPGGFGGGPGFGGPLPSGGLTMTLFANTQNLLNRDNLGTPSGVLTSPYFMQSTSEAGTPRIIEVGARFNF